MSSSTTGSAALSAVWDFIFRNIQDIEWIVREDSQRTAPGSTQVLNIGHLSIWRTSQTGAWSNRRSVPTISASSVAWPRHGQSPAYEGERSALRRRLSVVLLAAARCRSRRWVRSPDPPCAWVSRTASTSGRDASRSPTQSVEDRSRLRELSLDRDARGGSTHAINKENAESRDRQEGTEDARMTSRPRAVLLP